MEITSSKKRNGYVYILKCANNNYYTGSTVDLDRRLMQHQLGVGANYTRKHLPVQLVYYERFNRIEDAFYREKQIQGWSKKKKEALINGNRDQLNNLAECKNETHFRNYSLRLRSENLRLRSENLRLRSENAPTSLREPLI